MGALALHGLLLLVRAHHVPTRPNAAAERAAEEFEVEEAPESPAAQIPPSSAQDSDADARAENRAPGARPAHRAQALSSPNDSAPANEAPSSDGPASDGAASDGANASAEPSAAPARKIDFGLDGHFFMHPPSEQLPRVHKSEFQHQLDAAVAADELKHGLARGNALIGSLNAAARESGPVRGEALLRVTIGPDGNVSEVEMLRGAAGDWAPALVAFRALAAKKHVRVPSGARGLRVTFAVKAKVQMPAGDESGGVHLATPSLEPNGFTPHGQFDLADLGGGPQRLVYAHIVSEEWL